MPEGLVMKQKQNIFFIEQVDNVWVFICKHRNFKVPHNIH